MYCAVAVVFFSWLIWAWAFPTIPRSRISSRFCLGSSCIVLSNTRRLLSTACSGSICLSGMMKVCWLLVFMPSVSPCCSCHSSYYTDWPCQVSLSDDSDTPMLPSSLMLLNTAHEYLGRRSLCCNSDGSFLKFYVSLQTLMYSVHMCLFIICMTAHFFNFVDCLTELYSHVCCRLKFWKKSLQLLPKLPLIPIKRSWRRLWNSVSSACTATRVRRASPATWRTTRLHR